MARLRPMRFRGRPGGSSVAGSALLMGIGGVTDSAATYRARTNESIVSLKVRYSTDSGLSGATTTSGVTVSADDDYTGGESLSGLSANTTYYYDLLENDVSQFSAPYPRFKTFPTEGVDADLTIVVSSCQKRATDAVTGCWAAAAAEAPDLHLQLGDFVYGDHKTLANLRTAYRAEYAGDQQTYVTYVMPRAQTYDDHDYGENNGDGSLSSKALAKQVWREYVPSYPLWDSANHIGYSFKIANCEFFVVDTRYQRESSRPRYPTTFDTFLSAESGTTTTDIQFPSSPTGPPDGARGYYAIIHDGVGGPKYYRRFVAWNSGTRVGTLDRAVPGLTSGWSFACKRASMIDKDILTDGQVDRLCDGIVNSTARWKFLCTSVIWNRRFTSASGLNDTWSQWDIEWFEREYIRQRIGSTPNVIVLSGDRHFSGIDDGTLATDGPDWPEMTSSAFHRVTLDPVGDWSHGTYKVTPSYGLIEIDGTNHTCTLTVKTNTGATATDGGDPITLVVEAA